MSIEDYIYIFIMMPSLHIIFGVFGVMFKMSVGLIMALVLK